MKIQLINFRCHTDAIFTFHDDLITRIKSEPGDGKSTIFEAIYWALYGSMNNIANHLADPKSQTKVTIDFSHLAGLGKGITIYRQNHPNRLILKIVKPINNSLQSINYEDIIAQNIIDDQFGTKKIWSSISYLRQGSQCVLLSGNKKDRYHLLQEISARNDNPSECIAKIDARLKEERIKFRENQVKFETGCSILRQELDSNPLPTNIVLTDQYKQKLFDIISKLKSELQMELSKEEKRNQLIGSKRNLESMVERWRYEINKTIDSCKLDQNNKTNNCSSPEFELTQLNNKLKTYSKFLDSLEKQSSFYTSELEKEEKDYDNIMSEYNKLNSQLIELSKQYQIENERESLRQQCKTSIKYNNETISKLESSLLDIPDIEILNKNLELTKTSKHNMEQELRDIINNITKHELSYNEKLRTINEMLQVKEQEKVNNNNYSHQLNQQLSDANILIKRIGETSAHTEISIRTMNDKIYELDENIKTLTKSIGILPDIYEQRNDWPSLLDVGRTEEMEAQINNNKNLAEKYQLKYDSNLDKSINNWDDVYKAVYNEHNKLKHIEQMLKIFAKLINNRDLLIDDKNTKLPSSLLNDINSIKLIRSSTKHKIEEYRQLLANKKISSHIVVCPKCNEKLRIDNISESNIQLVPLQSKENLYNSDNLSIDNIEKILIDLELLVNDIDKLEELSKLYNISDELRKKYFNEYPEKMLDIVSSDIIEKKNYIDQLDNYLRNIRNIKWIEPPKYDSKYLRSLVELRKHNIDIINCKNQIKELNNKLSEQNSHLDAYSKQIDEYERSLIFTNKRQSSLLIEIKQLDDEKSSVTRSKNNDVLIKLINNKKTKEESISELNQKLHDIESQIKSTANIKEQIKDKNDELIGLNVQLNDMGVSILETIQIKIEQINDSLNKYKEKLDKEKLETLRMNIKKTEAEISSVNKAKYSVKNAVEHIDKIMGQISIAESELVTMINQLNDLGINNSSIIRNQIELNENNIRHVDRGLKLLERQYQLTNNQQDLNNQQLSLAALEEYRLLAERVQYKSLEETILSINNAMNVVFEKVFDDNINVQLKLFRQLKTKKRETPHVNCIIYYKGAQYNNISLISGGERNRLNLGMILALNLVSSSPLVILDECTNFLNNRLRNKCIAAIKKLIKGHKTILTVCHEDNDANYDHVVPLLENENLDFSYPIVDK